MKFNLSQKLHSSLNRLVSNPEADSFYEVPEVSEPVFWLVFSVAFLFALVLTPLRKWLIPK